MVQARGEDGREIRAESRGATRSRAAGRAYAKDRRGRGGQTTRARQPSAGPAAAGRVDITYPHF